LRCPPERRAHYAQLAASNVPNEVSLFEVRKIPNSAFLEKVPFALSVPARLRRSRDPKPSAWTEPVGNGTDEYLRIERLVDSGKAQEALALVEEALRVDPESSRLLHLKGTALGLAGNHESALESFLRLTELHPRIATAWYHKGIALAGHGRLAEAVEAYLRAKALNPGDASTSFNLGATLCQLEDYGQALRHLEDASRLGHPRAESVLSLLRGGLPAATQAK
jgi:Flp pilus assembly protein TadD